MDGQEKKSSGFGKGCLVAALIMVGIMVLGIAGLIFLFASLSKDFKVHGRHGSTLTASSKSMEGGEDEIPVLNEVWSGGSGETKVVRIPLSGVIFLGENSWMGDTTPSLAALRAIKRATHDSEVEGIILEIDSGGGGITASDIIYKALLDFRQARKGRVVVTIMGDVAASGAYYISLASDLILAHPTTITGSIGVIMESYNIEELAKKIGVKDVTFKSGANKDLMNPFHEVSPEQRALLQAVVDSLYKRFVHLVAESRKIPEDEVRKIADGRIFTADDAVELKLIDGIGYSGDAEKEMAKLLNTSGLKIYRYEEENSFFDLLRMRRGFGANVSSFLEPHESRLMYRWSF